MTRRHDPLTYLRLRREARPTVRATKPPVLYTTCGECTYGSDAINGTRRCDVDGQIRPPQTSCQRAQSEATRRTDRTTEEERGEPWVTCDESAGITWLPLPPASDVMKISSPRVLPEPKVGDYVRTSDPCDEDCVLRVKKVDDSHAFFGGHIVWYYIDEPDEYEILDPTPMAGDVWTNPSGRILDIKSTPTDGRVTWTWQGSKILRSSWYDPDVFAKCILTRRPR